MKIIGVVTFYYPEKKVWNNISTYIEQLDKLIIWENTPSNDSKPYVIPWKDKVEVMGLGKNVGIGKALNEVILYARENNYAFLLTMDQDSYFENSDFEKYVNILKQSRTISSILSPNYIIHEQYLYPYDTGLVQVDTTLTSGSLYPMTIFDQIGLFRDDFFIDVIDLEYSLRAKRYGITTQIATSIRLYHAAGYQKTKHKFLWKTFFPNEYSPMRSYYIVRNGILAMKLYPNEKNWNGYLFYWFYKRMFFVLLYEDQKLAKLKSLLLGFIHGKFGKTGEYVF